MENKKFYLRPLKENDAIRMLEWMQNEEIIQHLNIGGKDTKLESVQRFIASAADESVNIHRAIVDGNDKYLGTISLKHVDFEKKEAEYAISLHMDAVGTGASMAATKEIMRFAFDDLNLSRILLCVSKANLRAIRFYNKVGFVSIPCPGYGSYLQENLLWFEQCSLKTGR